MMSRQKRFAVGVGIILAALGYFAFVGYQEGKAYYKTIDEVAAMGDDAMSKRLRVAGVVQPGSIERNGREMSFTLAQLADGTPSTMAVAYIGTQPIPDTFKDGADAIVEGHRQPDGTFAADHIQAKCASKYEAKYGSEAQHPSQIPMNGSAADSASGGSY